MQYQQLQENMKQEGHKAQFAPNPAISQQFYANVSSLQAKAHHIQEILKAQPALQQVAIPVQLQLPLPRKTESLHRHPLLRSRYPLSDLLPLASVYEPPASLLPSKSDVHHARNSTLLENLRVELQFRTVLSLAGIKWIPPLRTDEACI